MPSYSRIYKILLWYFCAETAQKTKFNEGIDVAKTSKVFVDIAFCAAQTLFAQMSAHCLPFGIYLLLLLSL